MYKKNDASPKPLFACVVNASTGAPITSGVACKHYKADGTESECDNSEDHEGNGTWRYVPSQAETNETTFAVKFYHADAVGDGPLVQVVTTQLNPDDPVRMGMTSLPNAAAQAAGGLYTRGSGAGQINQAANGQVDTNVVYWLGQACVGVGVNGVPVVDVTHVHGSALAETSPGYLAAAFVKLFDVATPLLVASDVMKGTDNASTHDAAAVVTALETDGSKLDHLWEMTENDGGTRRLTTNALEQGPDSDTTTGLTLHSNYDAAKTAAQAGNAMALTSGERTTLAAAIEAAIINELDGNAVMQAIADLIADDMTTGDLSVVAIAAACRDAILDRVLAGNHDTVNTTGKVLQDVLGDTNELQTDDVPGLITALNNLSSAQAQAAADAALVANHLDHLFKTDYDPASKPGVATALLNELIESNAGVSRYTAAALAQAPSGSGGDATEAKQDTIISTLTTVAKTGADSDTLETLSDQLDGLEALSGEGAYTGTLTIDDGSTGLQGAVVNARRGGVLKASGTTDASGEITNWVFGAYTYDLAVRLPGYEPETDTIAVSADAWSKTISLTANTISAPPSASTTTGVMTVYDEEGSVEESVEVSVQIIDGPGTAGIGYDSTVWTETSSALGVVEFAGIILGARYRIWRGDSKPNAETFTAPTSGDSFDLAEVIGRG